MDLRKVYNATIDPLEDAGSVNLILNQYFASKNREDYSGNLRDTESKFLECFAFAPEEIDRFTESDNATHCILFNKWMNDIRRISKLPVREKNEFFERVSRASYDIPSEVYHEGRMNAETAKTAFNKIASKINKKSFTVSKKSQIEDFKNSFSDANVIRMFELLNWFSPINRQEDIMSFKANYLLTGEKKDARKTVFIAVVPNKINVTEFTNEYLKRCDKYNVSYDLDIPYDKYSKRVIRINSTVEDLGKNLAIIEDISEKFPEMIKKMEKPPVLCGKINNWIGIGAFSAKELERSGCGYTEKRANLIVDAIENVTKKYIVENYKKPFSANGKTKSLKQHLTDYTYVTYLDKITEIIETYYREMRTEKSAQETEELVKQYFGFNRNDLKDLKYLKMTQRTIEEHVSKMLAGKLEGDYNSIAVPNPEFARRLVLPGFLFSTEKMSDRRFHVAELFPEVLKRLASDIAYKDPRFKSDVVKEIKHQFTENGIAKKSCFEDYAVNRMFELSQDESLDKILEEKTTKIKNDREDR